MKTLSFLQITLFAWVLFISQTAHAQWIDGTAVYLKNLNKKVGVGVANPSYQLDVKGDIGLQSAANGYFGSLSDDLAGNLVIASYSTSSYSGILKSKNLILNPPVQIGISTNGGNAPTRSAGQVGIGTSNPAEAKLVVQGDVGHTVAMFGQGQAGISLVRDWATVGFNAYYNGGWKSMSTGYGALIGCDPTTGRIEFIQNSYANANAAVSHTYPLVIASNGNVGIGTGNPTFKLAVNGTIRAKEIRVETGWADYVFADDYQLRPLAEVEAFVKANKHLPEIPTATEIQTNGLDVAATTTKMMAKIEELTLYLIELKKENDALQARVQALEKQ